MVAETLFRSLCSHFESRLIAMIRPKYIRFWKNLEIYLQFKRLQNKSHFLVRPVRNLVPTKILKVSRNIGTAQLLGEPRSIIRIL